MIRRMARPARVQSWMEAHRALILCFVIGAGFFIAPNPAWAMVYYLGVLPSSGLLLARRDGWPTDPGGRAGVALIGWFTLATLWDAAAGPHIGIHVLWVWNGLCTLVFFLGSRAAFGPNGAERERLVTTLLACGFGNAVLSIVLFAMSRVPIERMGGWAETRHPILGASIIGVSVVLAVGMLLQRRLLYLSSATIVAGLSFIVLTGSRGPLIAIVLTIAFLLAATRPRTLMAVAVSGVTAFLVTLWVAPDWISATRGDLLQRGWSNRLIIWKLSLNRIAERPLFGFGPSARIGRPGEDFPHDLFLSTLFYGGAVGLVLLLALFIFAARAAAREQDRVVRWTLLALLVHTVLSGITDLSVITKGPSPMWYIVWLPIVLALGANRSSGPLFRGNA